MALTFILAIIGAWIIIRLSNKGIIPLSRRKWFWCLLVLSLLLVCNRGFESSESSSYSEQDLGTISSKEDHTFDIPLVFQGEKKFSDIRFQYYFTKKNGVEVMDANAHINGLSSCASALLLMEWSLSVSRPTVTVSVPEKEGGFLIYPVFIKYYATFKNKTFFWDETRIRNETITLRIKRPILKISQEKK